MDARTWTLSAAVAAVLVIATGAVAQEQAAVEVQDDRFTPARVEVAAGGTVTWTQTGSNLHSVVADDESFRSGGMNQGDTFAHTFSEPGEHPYHCDIHGAAGGLGMAGVVVVTSAEPDPDPTPEPEPEPEPDESEACPAGAEHDFSDVEPDNVHNDAIACMSHRGVVHGFADGTFGPHLAVRRDQMATFIARTLAATGRDLPPPQNQGFADIDGNPHADAINSLAEAGIVRGTTSTTYSPAAQVRRDQVAAFLVRAVEWAHATSLQAQDGPYFADTAGNTHEQAIDVAFEQGLVSGQRPPSDGQLGEYGPALATTRAQMASVTARLLALLWEQ